MLIVYFIKVYCMSAFIVQNLWNKCELDKNDSSENKIIVVQ